MEGPFPTSLMHVKSIGPDSSGVHAPFFVGVTEVTPDLLQAVTGK